MMIGVSQSKLVRVRTKYVFIFSSLIYSVKTVSENFDVDLGMAPAHRRIGVSGLRSPCEAVIVSPLLSTSGRVIRYFARGTSLKIEMGGTYGKEHSYPH